MKYLFYLAGVLLFLSGIFHLVQVFTAPYDPAAVAPTIFTAIFGVAYLVIGALLALGKENILLYGVIVPLLGGLFSLMSLSVTNSAYATLVLLVGVAVAVICAFLMRAGRPTIGRVKR